MSQSSVTRLMVGKNAANTFTAPTNAITNISAIAVQDIYFVDADGGATHGNILDATTMASATKFSVVTAYRNQDGSTRTYVSDPVVKSSIIKATRDAYTASTQQVTYLGYDTAGGSTKDITLTNNKPYKLNISIKTDNRISEFHEQFGPIFGALGSFAGATATFSEKLNFLWPFIKVVNGTTSQSNAFGNTGKPTSLSSYVTAEIVTNAVGTAFTNAVTITNGSTTLTSTAHGRSVGDFIRIGATAASVTTNGVYRVSAIIDANNLTIDTPYKGASLSAVAGGAAHTLITNTAVGIRLTGKDVPFFKYAHKNTVRFFASFFQDDENRNVVNAGFTADNTTTEAVLGSGTPDQIYEKEMSYLANMGYFNYFNRPDIQPFTYSSSSLTYDFYTIEYSNEGNNDFTQGKNLRGFEFALVPASAQATALQLVMAALPTYTSI